MQTCDHCPKQWDCYEACEKVIEWQELQKEDTMPYHAYDNKGVPLFTKTGAEKRRQYAARGGHSSARGRASS